MSSIAAEIHEIRAVINGTMNSLDDAESARDFLPNWFSAMPDALIASRYSWEANERDNATKFIDAVTGKHQRGLRAWGADYRIRISPAFRALTGNHLKAAIWCLEFQISTLPVMCVGAEEFEAVRDFFCRIEDRAEGTGDDVCQEAAYARQQAECRAQELREEEEEMWRRDHADELAAEAAERAPRAWL